MGRITAEFLLSPPKRVLLLLLFEPKDKFAIDAVETYLEEEGEEKGEGRREGEGGRGGRGCWQKAGEHINGTLRYVIWSIT